LLDSLQVGNAGFMVLLLAPFDERTEQGITAFDVLAEAQRRVATIPEAQVMVFNVPPIPGLGTTAGFDFRLESRSGGTPAELGSVAGGLVFAANSDPRLGSVFTTFSVTTPRLIVDLDREKAQTLGVSIDSIYGALQTTLGGLYVNDFNRFGRTWRVNVQGEAAG